MTEKKFIPGLELSERFYTDVVKGIIKDNLPNLRYAAGLIGPGSEVLGFDDTISRDHHWGPRLQLFLENSDYQKYSDKLDSIFRKQLPYVFLGYSTNWSEPDPNDNMTQMLKPISKGTINHRIEIYTVTSYLKKFLNITDLKLSERDWLLFPEQRLLEFTSGKVFHDEAGELTKAREVLHYYPTNVWKFKLMALWEKISQEMAFVGRTGIIGDDLGSRIEATRLVRNMMMIAYVLERQYIPYAKWLGHGFKTLPIANKLGPILSKVLTEEDWRKREEHLCEAYLILLTEQNELMVTPSISLKPQSYFKRPQVVIDAGKVVNEVRKSVLPPLNSIKYPIGTINEFIDEMNTLTDAEFVHKVVCIDKSMI